MRWGGLDLRVLNPLQADGRADHITIVAPRSWDSRLVFAPAERSAAIRGEARFYPASSGDRLEL
jgi:hypothetical protein